MNLRQFLNEKVAVCPSCGRRDVRVSRGCLVRHGDDTGECQGSGQKVSRSKNRVQRKCKPTTRKAKLQRGMKA
jgi:hypothetical protein